MAKEVQAKRDHCTCYEEPHANISLQYFAGQCQESYEVMLP